MTSPFLPCKSELKKSLKEVELLCFTELRDPVLEQEIEEATAGANSATVVVVGVVGIAQLNPSFYLRIRTKSRMSSRGAIIQRNISTYLLRPRQ